MSEKQKNFNLTEVDIQLQARLVERSACEVLMGYIMHTIDPDHFNNKELVDEVTVSVPNRNLNPDL